MCSFYITCTCTLYIDRLILNITFFNTYLINHYVLHFYFNLKFKVYAFSLHFCTIDLFLVHTYLLVHFIFLIYGHILTSQVCHDQRKNIQLNDRRRSLVLYLNPSRVSTNAIPLRRCQVFLFDMKAAIDFAQTHF